MRHRIDQIDIPQDDPFKNDVLGRKPIVDFLSALIEKSEGPLVLGLDAEWGTGKSTVIKMLKASLDNKGFSSVYFSAWEVDYLNDPLVTLVGSINQIKNAPQGKDKGFNNDYSKLKKVTGHLAKRSAIAAVKAVTLGGLDLEKEIEEAAAEFSGNATEDIVDAFIEEQDLIIQFKKQLDSLVSHLEKEGKPSRLIFFIDEIDRCKPTFAIELLERIKHLFDVENIVFVLSLDKTQLLSSIKAVYGSSTNGEEYLRRFVDLEYTLPIPKPKKFVEYLFKKSGLDEKFAERTGELQYDRSNFIELFSALAEVFDLSLRIQERCISRLCLVMEQTPSNFLLLPHATALLILLRIKAIGLYKKIANGEEYEEEIVKLITNQPKSNKVLTDRALKIIKAYLIILDPDRDRSEARVKALQEIEDQDPRSKELLRMIFSINNGPFDAPSMSYLTSKIDFVSDLR